MLDRVGEPAAAVDEYTGLWDWRRRIAELYAAARRHQDPAAAALAWRQGRDQLFGEHEQSPLDPDARARFAGLSYFPYDPAFRFAVELQRVSELSIETQTAGDDGMVVLTPFARTRGLDGALAGELTLYWIGGYGGGVFLPFRDPTSGNETFGGGRYLLDTIKSADLGGDGDGRVILDFNFAYNPSCAYSERWICPLAPPLNRLGHAVRAGEKNPSIG